MSLNCDAFISEFKEYVDKLSVKSAMEVGALTGELMKAVGADGIDLNPSLPEVKKRDIRKYKGKKYDLVFGSGVVEHYNRDDAVEVIKAMANASKEYVLNYVPNSGCEAYMNAKKYRSKNWPVEWRNELDYTAEGLAEIHRLAGLEVVDIGTAATEWAKKFGKEPSEPYLVFCLARKRGKTNVKPVYPQHINAEWVGDTE